MRGIRCWLMLVLGILALSCGRCEAQDDRKAKSDESPAEMKVSSRDRLMGRLRLYDPVNIHGPYPYLLYTARTGDLVELQLSYPIAPPFPKSISVTYNPLRIEYIDVVATDNRVLMLRPGETQTGNLGMGYYSVYLRAKNDGDTRVDVTVKLADGDTETVPFNFKISPEAKTAPAPTGAVEQPSNK
jgi:hypothetical protein